MRELTTDELAFLAEVSEQNFYHDFLLWIEHMEDSYS